MMTESSPKNTIFGLLWSLIKGLTHQFWANSAKLFPWNNDHFSSNLRQIICIYPGFWDILYFSNYGITLSTIIQLSKYPAVWDTLTFSGYIKNQHISIYPHISRILIHTFFQIMALLYQQSIQISKYPAIWDTLTFSGYIKNQHISIHPNVSRVQRHTSFFKVRQYFTTMYPCIQISKHPAIWDMHTFSGYIKH